MRYCGHISFAPSSYSQINFLDLVVATVVVCRPEDSTTYKYRKDLGVVDTPAKQNEKETLRTDMTVRQPMYTFSMLAPIGLAFIVAIAIRSRKRTKSRSLGERRKGYQKRLESVRHLKVEVPNNDHSDLPALPRSPRRRKKQSVSIPLSPMASPRRRTARAQSNISPRDTSESSELALPVVGRTVAGGSTVSQIPPRWTRGQTSNIPLPPMNGFESPSSSSR